jgi:prophage antirepressor-like protein
MSEKIHQPQTFDFYPDENGKPFTIRFVTDKGKLWIHAGDICKALGLSNTSKAVQDADLEEDEKNNFKLGNSEGRPPLFVSETGYYGLVGNSRKPVGKKMRRWLRREVIPAIVGEGGYLSSTATPQQLIDIGKRAFDQAELGAVQARGLSFLKEIVDGDWLETKSRMVAARMLGEEPEIDPLKRPLTVGEYLTETDFSASEIKCIESLFGRRMKEAFRSHYKREPGDSLRDIGGTPRPVAAYTEDHRFLFDKVMRAGVTRQTNWVDYALQRKQTRRSKR